MFDQQTAQQELDIILSLELRSYNRAKDIEQEPGLKLLRAWEKRSAPHIEKSLAGIDAKKWRDLPFPLDMWALEQKWKYPGAISCTANSIFSSDDPMDNRAFEFFIYRLDQGIRDQESVRNLTRFISTAEIETSVLDNICKNPVVFAKLNAVLDALMSDHKYSCVFQAFPSQVTKKFKPQNAIEASNSIKAQIKLVQMFDLPSFGTKPSEVFQKTIVPLIKDLPFSEITALTIDRIKKAMVEHLSFDDFDMLHKTLRQNKWSEKSVMKFCPDVSLGSGLKDLQKYIPYWIKHKNKDLMDKIKSEIFIFPHSHREEKALKFMWKCLGSSGLSLVDVDKNFAKNNPMEFEEIMELTFVSQSDQKQMLKTLNALIESPESKYFPTSLLGTYQAFAQALGGSHPITHQPLLFSKCDEKNCDDYEDYFGKKEGREAFDAQEKYKALCEKFAISSALEKDDQTRSKRSTRKI